MPYRSSPEKLLQLRSIPQFRSVRIEPSITIIIVNPYLIFQQPHLQNWRSCNMSLNNSCIPCSNQNTNYVIYPRSSQAYNDARTSTWMNQKGYIALAGASIPCSNHQIPVMLYIPETLRHTVMRGLLPGQTREDT